MKKLISIFIFTLSFFVVLFSSCAKKDGESFTGFAMGSPVSITVYGKHKGFSGNDAVNKAKQLEGLISSVASDAEVYRLNESEGPVKLSAETIEIINRTEEIYKETSGRASVAAGALTNLWGFETDDFKQPSDDQIKKALISTIDENIIIDGDTVELKNGAKLNLGSVGKGRACDNILKYIKEYSGITGAVAISGGSVGVFGKPLNRDSFTIGIRNPYGKVNDYFATVNLNDSFISTSGDYEKTFTGSDGKKYFHILDLKTGYPVKTDLTSVSVIAKNGLTSDALSTACFILGEEKSLKLLKKYDAEAVFVYHDKTVSITSGLSKVFELKDSAYRLK